MLLLIDAGNTRIKWALADTGRQPHDAGAWAASGSVLHADMRELERAWQGLDIQRVLIANVAGQSVQQALQQILHKSERGVAIAIELFVSTASCGGVRNCYRQPSQLGCDRFAAAIGARALYPDRSLIVATCGTATTIDAVSRQGDFIGGMILPGVALMAASLAGNTAQLPQVTLDAGLISPFADHTDAAIVSGCMAAQAGAIERAVAALQRESGDGDVTCILAGGASDLIAPHVRIVHERIDNLVLIGLHMVATSTC